MLTGNLQQDSECLTNCHSQSLKSHTHTLTVCHLTWAGVSHLCVSSWAADSAGPPGQQRLSSLLSRSDSPPPSSPPLDSPTGSPPPSSFPPPPRVSAGRHRAARQLRFLLGSYLYIKKTHWLIIHKIPLHKYTKFMFVHEFEYDM